MSIKLVSTLFLVLFLSVSSVNAGTISKPPYSLTLTSGLVGHWTFDGANITSGRINDISGQGNHGNAASIATSTFYAAGKIGQGGNFDGSDDQVTLPYISAFTTTGTYSVSMWFKANATTGALFEMSNASSNRNAVTFSSNKIRGGYYNGSSQIGKISTSVVSTNVWHHVVYINNAGVTSLYLDNEIQSTDSFVAGPSNGSKSIACGAVSACFNGVMDDVRTYDRALSASEVTQLYNFGGVKKSASVAPPGLKSGLLAHWTFDGKDMSGGVARDISGQGNNGNPTNIATSTFYTVGKIGQGAKFDGVDDVVNMPNMDILESGNMSFSFWINLNGSQNLRWIMNQWNSSNQGPAIFIDSDGTLSFEIGSYGSGRIDTSATFPINTWTYVTATASGNVLTLYINGIQSVQATVVRTESSASQIFSLAGTHDSLVAISGLLDDVRIYSRALSTSEIAELYSAGTPKQNVTVSPTGLKSGLVGHWTFDGKDMSGGVARDISGQGNHGNTSGISTSTFYTVGKIGQGAKFDGVDDYITFASSPTPGSEMTVSTWVYKSADGILVYRGSSACCLSYHLKITSGKARFAIVTTSGSNPDIEIISNASIPDNTWTLVTATYSSSNSNLSLYINGTFDTSGSYTGTIYNSVVTMNIGAQNTPSSFLTGTLDDIRIYSRALSVSEILQLYSAGR